MDPIERADKVRSALYLRGLTLLDIDRQYGLPLKTAHTTLREPNARGEEALCDALALDARELWPERYDAGGHRLSPQPSENYRRPPTRQQRRKARAAYPCATSNPHAAFTISPRAF